MNAIEDQPNPTPERDNLVSVWEMVVCDTRLQQAGHPMLGLVLADMWQRDRLGRERYGTPLQANNGRRADIDAYQEALDLCAYLRQGIEEGRALHTPYRAAIEMVVYLRDYICEREKEAQAAPAV